MCKNTHTWTLCMKALFFNNEGLGWSIAPCWHSEESDSNEFFQNGRRSCLRLQPCLMFQSGLINKHFPRYGRVPLGDLLLHLFSRFCASPKKRLYYYVKLCLWKHKFAPLLRSPSPGWLGDTFPHSGWETAAIEARCAPTFCLRMCRSRIPQPDQNSLQLTLE